MIPTPGVPISPGFYPRAGVTNPRGVPHLSTRSGFSALLKRGGPGSHDVIAVSDWFPMMTPSWPTLRLVLFTTTRIHFSLLRPRVMVEGAPCKFSTIFNSIIDLFYPRCYGKP